MTIEGIPKEMKAVQLVEYNKPYELRTIPTPTTLGPHDLLVKIACASICHTEQLVSSGVFQTELPCTVSHEGSGIIAAVGSSQTNSWKPGDRVLCGIPRGRCGECPDCLGPERYTNYCPYVSGHCGVTTHGALAEYMIIDGREASHLPPSIPFEEAAPLACAGRTIYRGLLLCREAINDHQTETKTSAHPWIALVGSGGGLGHLGIQLGQAMGFRIIGVDATDSGLAMTRACGADLVLDAREPQSSLISAIATAMNSGHQTSHSPSLSPSKFTGPLASIVLADPGTPLACALTRMHGTVIQIAQPETVGIPFAELVFRDIRLRGSLLCSRAETEEMLALVAEKGVRARVKTYRGLESVEECVGDVKAGRVEGKGVVVVDSALCGGGGGEEG